MDRVHLQLKFDFRVPGNNRKMGFELILFHFLHTYLIIFQSFQQVVSRLTNPDLFLSLFIYFFSAKKPLTGSKSAPNPTFNAGNNLLEKTTEGVLKAARLGDLQMLSELHHQGYSLLSIDETGKTALHYGSRFGKETVIFNFTEK